MSPIKPLPGPRSGWQRSSGAGGPGARRPGYAAHARPSCVINIAAELAKPNDERNAVLETQLAQSLNPGLQPCRRAHRPSSRTLSRLRAADQSRSGESADLRAQLRPGQAFLSYVIGVRGSYGLLVTADGLTMKRLGRHVQFARGGHRAVAPRLCAAAGTVVGFFPAQRFRPICAIAGTVCRQSQDGPIIWWWRLDGAGEPAFQSFGHRGALRKMKAIPAQRGWRGAWRSARCPARRLYFTAQAARMRPAAAAAISGSGRSLADRVHTRPAVRLPWKRLPSACRENSPVDRTCCGVGELPDTAQEVSQDTPQRRWAATRSPCCWARRKPKAGCGARPRSTQLPGALFCHPWPSAG